MNKLLLLSILFIILSCKKTTEVKNDENILVNKNYFSVSENDRKIRRHTNYEVKDTVEMPEAIYSDKRLNEDYALGGIHFLIENNEKSYYVINYLEPFVSMCGTMDRMTKQDSINAVNRNIKIIQIAKPISTSTIEKILYENREKIVNINSRMPLQISFALKDDTLKGQTMYNIIQFMEDSKMYIYTIRRMNKDEISFTKMNPVKR
ncbi:hypothetical protein QGN23_03295 [Chryseobacterium gotjawalense]|uniref:Lipoprotein n=1 Tax=Chryseobacterium gotjawalense TaxID=3042315 RepID=A0ABY8RER0_9FLAO|nr:hypothetical protein [Chryseobacterium sp. wdc7]WHF52311.1 hypothetical protein QGN23_03295 [Chryseobacterium sp. wdc7]